MAYRVKFLPRAEADLRELFEWLAENAPAQSAAWFGGLEQTINSLRNHPERCPVIFPLSTPARAIRRLLYGRKPHIYKIYFHVLGDTVEILHIRHGARKSPKRIDLPG